MRLFELDARLRAIADRVPLGARIWDVGSDHAKLPTWLVARGVCPSAVASDIGELPLASAAKTVARFGVEEKIALRLCDGLPADAEGAADVYVIAGMGGSTIADILRAAPWTQNAGVRLILQPMSSAEDLRELLYAGGYAVARESEVAVGARRYLIFEVDGGGAPEPYDLADLFAGKAPRGRSAVERALRRLKNERLADRLDAAELERAIAKLERLAEELSK